MRRLMIGGGWEWASHTLHAVVSHQDLESGRRYVRLPEHEAWNAA
ncbi:hypothetical protein OI450_02435 [Pectobacterium cacticida]|uniref:Uncharacterized protein n=1 Tax=Pectobacterium cacticida TaxID=69221 RepID=A0ABZ2G932_9GAMM|nr:hypothetical protein [Pectobacterium cacticida]UYX07300.1 hypothetical protein OI450_02435 [Pectobacterium cacticida]